MRQHFIPFLSLLLFGTSANAEFKDSCSPRSNRSLQKLELKPSPDAEKMADKLRQNGFKCDSPAPSIERGYRCRGMLKNYPQAVNIFIPPSYQKAASGPLALHFHGHNLSNAADPSFHFNTANGNGDYGKMLAASGSNALLVIPESLGKCDTYANYFRSPANLDQLLKEIETSTDRKIKTISFSSHSGGDRTMDRLASWYLKNERGDYLGKTQNIALFDSLYANRESLAKWPSAISKEMIDSKFIGSYVVGPGASTSRHMEWLKTKHPPAPNSMYREVKTEHMAIMKNGGFSDFLSFLKEQ